MEILEIKETKAYQIMRQLNDELKQKGKLTVAGRVSKKYFDERMY
ncbi:transcriptional regulator [Carnobacterium sp. TMP28]